MKTKVLKLQESYSQIILKVKRKELGKLKRNLVNHSFMHSLCVKKRKNRAKVILKRLKILQQIW